MSLLGTARNLEPRILALALISAIAITATACYLYGLKASIKSYRDLSAQYEQALPLLSANASSDDQKLTLERELQNLEADMLDQSPPISSFIQTLDSLAQQYDIKLSSVSPLPMQNLSGATELSYEISAGGSYAAIQRWLRALTQTIAPAIIRQLIIESGPTPTDVSTRFIVSLYEREIVS